MSSAHAEAEVASEEGVEWTTHAEAEAEAVSETETDAADAEAEAGVEAAAEEGTLHAPLVDTPSSGPSLADAAFITCAASIDAALATFSAGVDAALFGAATARGGMTAAAATSSISNSVVRAASVRASLATHSFCAILSCQPCGRVSVCAALLIRAWMRPKRRA